VTAVSGRGWAYAGVTLGAVVSLAANVAHSFVPPAGASPGWTPAAGSVVSAVCWPLLLLVAVEMFARIAWPPGRGWLLLRWLGLLPVALIAAVVSYRHLSGLLRWYGEDWLTYTFGPLAVDGLMVMATGALVGRRRASLRPSEKRAGSREPLRRTRAGTPDQPGASAREHTGTSARTIRRTDADLMQLLGMVSRDADGTVPVRRAARALGTGPDRARRLLKEMGLLRTTAGTSTGTTADGPDPGPVERPVMGREPGQEALR
jgi:hypothetical protein